MRLRASFTVENSFVIPICTMIIVCLIAEILFLHDNAIEKNALFIDAVKSEKYISLYGNSEAQDYIKEQNERTKNYLKEKTVSLKNICVYSKEQTTWFESSCFPEEKFYKYIGMLNHNEKKVKISKNYPPDYIRKIIAVDKLL